MQKCFFFRVYIYLQLIQNHLILSMSSLRWSEGVVTGVGGDVAASGHDIDVTSGAKLRGSALPSDSGRVKGQPSPSTSFIRKRALKRAEITGYWKFTAEMASFSTGPTPRLALPQKHLSEVASSHQI